MKVNMNQMPKEDQASKKSKQKTKPSASSKKKHSGKQAEGTAPELIKDPAAGGGNVYAESLKAYKDKWSTQKGGLLKQNKFWIILIIVLFLVFISVNSNINNTKAHLMMQTRQATAKTESLNNAVAEVKADLEEQARIDSVKLTQDEEELARNNAEAQGAHVAYLQNQYRTIDVDDPSFSDNMTKNKEDLGVCFDSDGEQMGKTVWYPYYDSGIPGNWEFASNASFKGNTAKSLWLCYADDPENPQDHSLLAYCTAKYNADTKLFTEVDVKLTRYAETNIGTDETYVNQDEQSIADQLKNLADQLGNTTPDASQEFDEETINTNNETFETRDQYKKKTADGEIEGEGYDTRYDVGLGTSEDEDSEDEGSEE